MRNAAAVLALVCLAGAMWVASARGAPPAFDPNQLGAKSPKQFYTNGMQVDTWNRDPTTGMLVTFWFTKNPEDSLDYRQLIAVTKDGAKIDYYEPVGRVFVGRYDMSQEGYSLLSPEHRKPRLEQIDESWFPPPSEPPEIHELFPPLAPGQAKNTDQLMPPPATMMFPRLRQSRWEGFYTALVSHTRCDMSLTFDGSEGEYEGKAPNGRVVEGVLEDVHYTPDPQRQMFVITGRWSAPRFGKRGEFRFVLMMMDLNHFRGSYKEDGRTDLYVWDGHRTSR